MQGSVLLAVFLASAAWTVTAEDGSKRIIGGTKVDSQNTYPWIVSLQYLQPAQYVGQDMAGHFCAGSLISSTEVLTAAHCVWDSLPSSFLVVPNKNNKISKLYKPAEVDYHTVASIRIHASYDDKDARSGNDIALITLNKPVTGVDVFPTLANATNDAKVGDLATVIGWGVVSNKELGVQPNPPDQFSCENCGISCSSNARCQYGFQSCEETLCFASFLFTEGSAVTCNSCGIPCSTGYCAFASECDYVMCEESAFKGSEETMVIPFDLRSVDVNIFADDDCGLYDSNKDSEDDLIKPLQICAGVPNGGKDSCQGDSGGPLIIGSKSSPLLVGVVSRGNDCAKAEYPGIYTEVSAFTSWVTSSTDIQQPSSSSRFPAVSIFSLLSLLTVFLQN